ncbi:beta strand repeat-containing protein [Streptomyces atratus]|uniref:beta strand repeat-containing protein n=1 Tax=Streptomyces atratus TaxID=1893 RepID=UPI0033C7CC51
MSQQPHSAAAAAATLPMPTLTVVHPDQRSGSGCITVSLRGSGFTGATAVRFGTDNAVSFDVLSDTAISAMPPAGSDTVQVAVTTPGGISNSLSFFLLAAPTLSSVAPSQGPVLGGATVTLTGTSLTGATAVSFGGTAASFAVVSATQVTATAPAGIAGPVQVTVTTPGGTSNELTYFFLNPPTLSAVAPSQGPVSGGTVVLLTGTSLTGTTAVSFGGTAAASFTVVSATQITATAPAGSGTVQVTATTPGGMSNSLSYSYVAAPALTTLSPSQGPVSGGTVVTLTGTNLTNVTAVSFGGTAASFTVVSATQITATAPAGSGTVQVTATTPGGMSNSLSYSYVAAPALTTLSPSQGPVSGGTVVTLTGTNLTGTTAVKFGGTAASFTVGSATQVTATTPPGTAGPVQVTATTPGGISNSPSYFFLNAPTLTALSPSQGPGGTVGLTGTNLTGATAVTFGGTAAASFTVVSATQITAVAPVGSGTINITVTTPGGTSNSLPYTYVAAPTLTGLAPNQGPVSGGATVSLTGTNLTGATAVKFGATSASFTVVSATQVTATTPPGTAGPAQVTVTTPGGTSGGFAYFYVNAPTLSSVAPSQGPVSGGATVTLTGTSLTGATAVSFGGTAALFAVVSATQVTATAPAGIAGPVQVTVTTPGGTSNGPTYFFLNPPTLSAVAPSQGPVSGGTMVTLTGTSLTGTTAVSFGGTAAASFAVVSATQITATAPAGSGTVQVTVTTPGGTSNSLSYAYVAAPTLTSVAPSQGPVSGGTTVTLTGANLTDLTAVSFGGTAAASFTVVSATQATATAPAGIAGPVQVTVTTPGGTSNGLTYSRIQPPGI